MDSPERLENEEAVHVEALAERSVSADLLKALRGFRVEWDDGAVGVAGAMAVFVRTAGYGTGHHKFELLTIDEVVEILPENRRILARSRPSPAETLGRALAAGLRRHAAHLLPLRRRPNPGTTPPRLR